MDLSVPCAAFPSHAESPCRASPRKRACSPWVSQLSAQAIDRVRSTVLNGRGISNERGYERLEPSKLSQQSSTLARHVNQFPSTEDAAEPRINQRVADLSRTVNALSTEMQTHAQQVGSLEHDLRQWRRSNEAEMKHRREEADLHEDYDNRLRAVEERLRRAPVAMSQAEMLALTESQVRADALEVSGTRDPPYELRCRQMDCRNDQMEERIRVLESSVGKVGDALSKLHVSEVPLREHVSEQFAVMCDMVQNCERRLAQAEEWMSAFGKTGHASTEEEQARQAEWIQAADKRLGQAEEWIAMVAETGVADVGMSMITDCTKKLDALEVVFEDIVKKLERSLQLAAAPAASIAETQSRVLVMEAQIIGVSQELEGLREHCNTAHQPSQHVPLSTIVEDECAIVEQSIGDDSRRDDVLALAGIEDIAPQIESHDRQLADLWKECRQQKERLEESEVFSAGRLQAFESDLLSSALLVQRLMGEFQQLASKGDSASDVGKVVAELQTVVEKAVESNFGTSDECLSDIKLLRDTLSAHEEMCLSNNVNTNKRLHYLETSIVPELKNEVKQLASKDDHVVGPVVEQLRSELLQLAVKDGKVDALTSTISEAISELRDVLVSTALRSPRSPLTATPGSEITRFQQSPQSFQQLYSPDSKATTPISPIRARLSELSASTAHVQQLVGELQRRACQSEDGGEAVQVYTSSLNGIINELHEIAQSIEDHSVSDGAYVEHIESLRSELLAHQRYLDTSNTNTSAVIQQLQDALPMR